MLSRDIQLRSRSRKLWNRPLVRALGCFASVFLASLLTDISPEADFVWIANGVLLAYLLLVPLHRWTVYLCTGFLAQCAAGALSGHGNISSTIFTAFFNINESLLTVLLLRQRTRELPDFTRPSYLARFIAYGVIVSPVFIGAVEASIAPLLHPAITGISFSRWVPPDALGVCIATPAFVAIFRTRFRSSTLSVAHWTLILLVLLSALILFSQTQLPLEFLLYPLLILVLLQLGLGWASLSVLLVATVAGYYTVHGSGPFAKSASIPAHMSTVFVQLFIGCAMLILYGISVVVEDLRRTERQLQQVAVIHKLVAENSRDIIIIADFEGNRSFISAAGSQWGGWSKEELLARKSLDLVHPAERPKLAALVQEMRSGRDAALVECRVQTHDGSYVWVEANLKTIRDPVSGLPIGILNSIREITKRKHAEEAREFQHSLIEAIHAVSLDGILVVDENERIVSCNQRFGEISGLTLPETLPTAHGDSDSISDADILVQTLAMAKHPDAFLQRVQELYANPNENDHCQIELKDGRTLERYTTALRSNTDQYLGRVWFFRDISQHKLAEQRLRDAYQAVETLAVTDALTGLANRRRFDQYLAAEWRRGIRDNLPLSLLLMDVDFFKLYNDHYGHLYGDRCLKQIAGVAQHTATRSGDMAARFGGEEFAVILPRTPQEGAIALADSILKSLRELRLPHAGSAIGYITMSIGCATVTPQLGADSASLIELADQALYRAKDSGRNCVRSAPWNEPESRQQKAIPIRSAAVKNGR